MKAKIAVATVSGKMYYLIIDELKRRKIPFISITPGEPVPVEIKVVLTTEEEKPLIDHEHILVYQEGAEPEMLVHQTLQTVQGKEYYEKIVVGIDPGEVSGWAVLADGKILETGNCFNVEETSERIADILLKTGKNPVTVFSVRVGDGAPAYREKLLLMLDSILPSNVTLESVGEAGTDSYLRGNKHRRGLRDIVSAIKIAGRNGQAFPRRKKNESNS